MTQRDDAFEDISSQLRVMGRRFRALISARAAEVHPQLQPASYYILAFLIENGPTRGSALACQFDIDKGAVSRQVQHLVDLGLAERAADPEDGRAQLLSASDKAIRLQEEAGERQTRRWQEQLRDWSDADLTSFAHQLERFNADIA